MTFTKFNEQAHVFLTAAIAFLLSGYPPIIAPVIVLLLLNWLSAPKILVQGLRNNLNTPSLLLMILLYALYLVGMLYTSNAKVGHETIETKMSFLIFPFVFSSYAHLCKINLSKYLKFFIYGTILNALICFSWAAYRFLKPVYVELYGIPYDLGASYFYYADLSVFLHPSYISMYSVFALIAIVHLINCGDLKLNLKWGGAIFLLVLFVLLLSSKAGWIGLFLFVLYFFRWLIIKKRIVLALIMLSLSIGLFTFLNVYNTPRFSTRLPQLSAITETIKGSNGENKKVTTSTDGSGSRVLVWKAGLEIIKENLWIGAGTGDAKDKMMEKYKEKGMISEYENKLNSHNQFLNTFIALGILGFTVLLLCFIVPFYFSIKEKTFLFAAFAIITGFNFSVESMLETQAGVIFYAFFYALLCYNFSNLNLKAQPQNPKSL